MLSYYVLVFDFCSTTRYFMYDHSHNMYICADRCTYQQQMCAHTHPYVCAHADSSGAAIGHIMRQANDVSPCQQWVGWQWRPTHTRTQTVNLWISVCVCLCMCVYVCGHVSISVSIYLNGLWLSICMYIYVPYWMSCHWRPTLIHMCNFWD